ncbi:LOW QUALITY PROTEIN: zinc finger and BTB domain-containing protein 40 [Mergus octosetaceus]
MELPSYSKQLLQQLYTLCKEQQFCDCTVFIGTVHFRAHKIVLAAASLLFKSLLDSTGTISIDASVVTPEEIALLLEMMYTGKLPMGKHNFTKVISVSCLQMFDVAVSCKNLLRDLLSSSSQDLIVREVSSQTAESSGNSTEADNLPQSEKTPAEEKTDTLHPQRVSPSPGSVEAETEGEVSLPDQELTTNHTWVPEDTMLSSSVADSGSHPDQPACAGQRVCAEEEPAEPLEKTRMNDLAAESKSCKLDFFLYESVFSEAHSNAQAVLRRLEECREIDASQREALVACLAEAGEHSVLTKLLGKVKDAQPLDAQTLVSLSKLFQDVNPKLRAALLEREQDGGEALQQTESTKEGEMLTARLLGCREELIQSVTQLSPIIEFLEAAEEVFLTPSEKRDFCLAALGVLDCCEGSSQREAVNNLLKKLEEEKTLKAEMATSESTATEIILWHGKLILETIRQRADLEGLAPGEAGLTEAVKELLSISAQKESSEASLKSALSTAQEKTVQAIKICQLLCYVHVYFPDLQPVMQELGHVGLLMEGTGEEAGIRKWKVNSESQVEALDKEEDGAEPKEPQGKASSKKSFISFICKACDKSFHFCCCLKVHMKCCRVARGKQILCKDCTEVKSTNNETSAGAVGIAKKKRCLPVACDIYGREFAHASGMHYHKLMEHFDKKPFSCEECGDKFASSSTLKNHLWLHAGDQPPWDAQHCSHGGFTVACGVLEATPMFPLE